MKEVMAIVRLNKVNTTKEALMKAGFPAFTCRKILGRGKQAGKELLTLPNEPISATMADSKNAITLSMNLIPKRFFTLVVEDEEVKNVMNAIISANSTGNHGDGKIFVLPIMDAYRVRDGKKQTNSESF